jgi:hypothetical protein
VVTAPLSPGLVDGYFDSILTPVDMMTFTFRLAEQRSRVEAALAELLKSLRPKLDTMAGTFANDAIKQLTDLAAVGAALQGFPVAILFQCSAGPLGPSFIEFIRPS